ncbi:MAG: hypothetical protein ACLUKN_13350 [Bacilli bacterium]
MRADKILSSPSWVSGLNVRIASISSPKKSILTERRGYGIYVNDSPRTENCPAFAQDLVEIPKRTKLVPEIFQPYFVSFFSSILPTVGRGAEQNGIGRRQNKLRGGDLQDSAMAFKVLIVFANGIKSACVGTGVQGKRRKHAACAIHPHHLRKNFSRGWKISQSENDSNTKTKAFCLTQPSLPQIGRKMQPTPIAQHTDKNQTSLPLPST